MDMELQTEKTKSLSNLDGATCKRLRQFASDACYKSAAYGACTFSVSSADPLACLASARTEKNFHYYWENPSENFALAAGGETLALTAEGANRFSAINEQRQQVVDQTATFTDVSHPQGGLLFLGGFSFFDEIGDSHWHSFDAASLTIPKWLILKNDTQTIATVFVDIRSFPGPEQLYIDILERLQNVKIHIDKARNYSFPETTGDISPDSQFPATLTPEYAGWSSSVKKARQAIHRNQFDKIVLARRFSVKRDQNLSSSTLLHRLRSRYHNCSCFLIHPPGGDPFIGATPEKLVSFRDDLLFTEALAGSIQRGSTLEEDAILENNLSESRKNSAEHQFVIRDIEQRLRPFSNKIRRNSTPEIKKLSNVQHLYTPIRAELKSGKAILAVLEQLHPTPAVGGYPREDAQPCIRELEEFERGWYAGPVGWLSASASGEFAVAIRSGLLSKDEAHFFAGSGIVADSNPQQEWEETNLKLKPMLSALQYD